MATYELTPPTVADVGALIRARTVDSDSVEVGTFTDKTRPTGEQVETYIDQAVDEVLTAVGGTFFRDEYARTGANLAAIRAAMAVELSHFPEQVSEGQSSYEQLVSRWEKGIGALAAAVRDGSPNRKGMFSVPVRPAGQIEESF